MDDSVATAPIGSLTEAQRECLRLVATHHNSKEIAQHLGVSPSAIDKRIERAVQQLGVRSRFAAARALAAYEGTPIADPDTSDWLPSDPIDLPADAPGLAQRGQDEPWWLVRRLVGLSSPDDRVGGQTRNRLSVSQRLGLILAVTLFVAVSSVAVLSMAVTLSGIVKDHHLASR